MDLSGTQGELGIPMHTASPYGGIGPHGGGGGGGGHVLQLHHDHGHGHGHHAAHSNNNHGASPPPQGQAQHGLPSPAAVARAGVEQSGKKRAAGAGIAVKYRECLKNHAAAIGGNATDGCGEFMPSGEEGSLEALTCSACGCHRNFHRKELDGGGNCDCGVTLGVGHAHRAGRRLLGPISPTAAAAQHKGSGLLLAASPADPYAAFAAARALPPPPPHHHMVMPLSAMQTSESDEMEGVAAARAPAGKKRFRTKFTTDQKERMLAFAEKVGWRLQKLDDGVVHQFCQDIGVKRRVLKVWMHNNKHNLAKKPVQPPPPPPPPPPPMQPGDHGHRSPSPPPPLRLE